MTYELPAPESPDRCWHEIEAVEYTHAELIDTMKALEQVGDLHEVLGLDTTGLAIATQVRLYDYGNLTDENGRKLNDKRENPVWYAFEAYGVKVNLIAIQAKLGKTATS